MKKIIDKLVREHDLITLDNYSNVETWERRRKDLKKEFASKIYGQIPKRLKFECKEIYNDDNYYAGSAKYKTIEFKFCDKDLVHTINVEIAYPKFDSKVPFIVYLDFRQGLPTKFCPIENILDKGFGIAKVCYKDITSDDEDFLNGLCKFYNHDENDFGKIGIWSMMASYILDYLENEEYVDLDNIAVAGCSRLGKTALVVGVNDERFKYVIAHNSGCLGVALNRYVEEGSEDLNSIYNQFPYWFSKNISTYNAKSLNIDQNLLLACIAPRYVMVGTAFEDVWAGTNSQYLSCVLASPIWELYGSKGLVCKKRFPQIRDNFIKGNIQFFLRDGTHYLSGKDWDKYLEFMNLKMKRKRK